MDFLEPLQVIWDYLGMHQIPGKADVIVGFGNFNTNIARRAAELYHQGLAPVVLPYCRRKAIHAPDLVLEGLYRYWQLNR